MGLNLRPKTPIAGAQNPKNLGTAPAHEQPDNIFSYDSVEPVR